MKSVALLAALLTLSACTSTPAGSAQGSPSPADPCAAARNQPPDGSQEERLQADLDGDGRSDEVVSWLVDGARVTQAWLADGQNFAPEPVFAGLPILAADVDGDGRAEVFAGTGTGAGGLFRLDGCRLLPVTLAGSPWSYPVGAGSALVCTTAPRLELFTTAAATSPLPSGGSDLTPAPGTPGTSSRVDRFDLAGGVLTAAGTASLPGPVPPGEPVRCG